MKKLWAQVSNNDRYSEFKREWKLGTLVGVTKLPYSDTNNLKAMLEEPKLTERYLIELDDGQVIEAWYWDTYEPVTKKSNSSQSATPEEGKS